MKYRKFVDNGDWDCIFCHERERDCCCGEISARKLGYKYEYIPAPKPEIKFPAIDLNGLDAMDILKESLRRSRLNQMAKDNKIGVWKKGNKWFRTDNDLVDYHNAQEKE